jgi:hypothetical protein
MPAVSQVHIDQALTNISVMYRNEAYVADSVSIEQVWRGVV